jgi:iron complex outermembrane receptor protein
MMRYPLCYSLLTALCVGGFCDVASADVSSVVVTATREAATIGDLPAAIDAIDQATIESGRRQVNLSETLSQVPGVIASERQNYAQDLQLSVRGFGARASFGVRGVRLYADGIPGTMPDGQGQFSHFDLGSAGRIEVLRGPFSALYGNSSGGVLALFTADGLPDQTLGATVMAGSLGTQRYAIKAAGDTGSMNYVIDASHFQTQGVRDHSQAERNLFNSKVRFNLANEGKLTVVANLIATPFVQDPLGLTRDQWLSDATQAGAGAQTYNSRKALDQEQIGMSYSQPLAASTEWQATLYGGHRQTVQFQARPKSTEQRPTDPGGVIDLARGYGGLDVHITQHHTLAGGPLSLTAGVDYDRLDEARRGYLNFNEDNLGVRGELRRDQANKVYDLDEYVQAQWQPTQRWVALLGVRNSLVDISSNDHLLSGAAATSKVRYSATNPVAGLTFHVAPQVDLYGSYGRGFETPTLNDLAYRSTDGSLPGLNVSLQAARSNNAEVGIKAGDATLSSSLAVFQTKTHDELAVASNSSGRSVYQNIGETKRQGAEWSMSAVWSSQWSTHIAYTYLNAVTVTPYRTCVTLPCSPQTIPSGNQLAAVPKSALYAGLTWHTPTPNLAITTELINRSKIYVDDRNSDAAPGYWLFNTSATLHQTFTRWRLSESLRIDNVANRAYVGSVIVNESNQRYFEPAPGRVWSLMVNAQFH